MRYKGKIEKLNHIIISDPSFEKEDGFRYEKENMKQKNWIIDIDIHPVITPLTDTIIARGTEFFILLSKSKRVCELKENGTIHYLRGITLNETSIDMETACVALGINDKAEEIISEKETWQPECSLKTTTDGIFGDVKEGIVDDRVYFIWISGYLDEDAGYTMDEIIDYLKEQLNITELEKDMQRPYIIRQQDLVEKIANVTLKFREITKEDSKLLEFFNEDNRFSNISFAGTYLAAIAVRNEQRKFGKLEGEMEKSPYSKEQEKLIDEYKKLQSEFEKNEKEIENNIDMEV